MSTLDYERILTRALAKLFPDEDLRARAIAILSEYGDKTHHPETARVHMAILKVAGGDLDALRRYTELADMDYRDMLCMAEYPSQSARWSLRDSNPEAYAALVQQDLDAHQAWIDDILAE